MLLLLILADDFTGALDTGVQFAACGIPTRVVVGEQVDFAANDAAVLVVDTETRHLPAAEAYAVIAKLTREAMSAGVFSIYKKTDSALRGNIGAELSALLKTSGERRLPFLPAFPQIDRVTRDGVHYISGVPVTESPFGIDPFEPVRHSVVRDVIASQTPVETCSVAAGAEAPEAFEGICVYDAATQGEVDAIASRLLADGPVLIAGCAGLAAGVARALGVSELPLAGLPQGNVAVVCGSVNPVSVVQCAYARAAGVPEWTVSEEQKKDSRWAGSPEFSEFAHDVVASWETRPLSVVDASAYTPAPDGASPAPAVRDQVAANLGALSLAVARAHTRADGYLFVMGGDVLLALVEAARVRTLKILGEVTTGVVASELVVDGVPVNVISKSGGFGEPDLFLRVSERLAASFAAA